MTVYDTIVALGMTNNGATLSQIVSFSGLPKKHVLKVLGANEPLFKTKLNTGKIIHVYRRLTTAAKHSAQATGQFYTENKINYGCEVSLEFPSGVNPEGDALRKPYTCGGFGDSHTIRVVLKDREEELRAIGMKNISEADLSQFPGYREWDEDVEDREAARAAEELVELGFISKHIMAHEVAEIIRKHCK